MDVLMPNERGIGMPAKSLPRSTVFWPNRLISGSSPRYFVHVCRFRPETVTDHALNPRRFATSLRE
jgi:hypothetical protein